MSKLTKEEKIEMRNKMMDSKNWAVVGATDKKERMGYQIVDKLLEHGYNVYPVSPNTDKIDGMKVYDTILDLPEKIDVVNMVVNPKISINILDQVKELGIKDVWFQEGSFDEEVLEKTEELGLNGLTGDCIHFALTMMELEE